MGIGTLGMEQSPSTTSSMNTLPTVMVDAPEPGPLTEQALLVLGAWRQLVEALRLLLTYVVEALRVWAGAHSSLAWAVVVGLCIGVSVWVASKVLTWRWERGLRYSRTGRLPEELSASLQDLGEELQEEGDEDSGLETAEDPAESTPKPPRSPVRPSTLSQIESYRRSASFGLGDSPSSESSILGKCRAFDGLPEDCANFFVQRLTIRALGPGEIVFENGSPRDSFLVVRSGQVVVETPRPATESGARAITEEYRLQAGESVVGLLFLLAGIRAGQSPTVPLPPAECLLHKSSACAGPAGAEIIDLPSDAFLEAFDLFPHSMLALAERLSARLAMVVLDILSTQFGLRRELMNSTPYTSFANDEQGLKEKSPSEIFAKVLAIEEATSDEVSGALAAATIITHESGSYVLPKQRRSTHLLVLLEGELWMDIQKPEQRAVPLSSPKAKHRYRCQASREAKPKLGTEMSSAESEPVVVRPGEAIGELSLLVDGAAPIVYICASQCRFAALPRDSVQRLLKLRTKTSCLRLLQLAAAKCASWLHRVDAALDWMPVEGGSYLFRKGDAMCGFFVVLSGRLLVLEEGEPHHEAASPSRVTLRVRDVLQRGSLCGELDCLRERPYSHTVRASRDTEVCRISPTLLRLVALEFPRAVLHFSALMGIQTEGDVGAQMHDKVTIVVLPASPAVPAHEICAELAASLNSLAKTLHISPDRDLVGRGNRMEAARDLDAQQLARILTGLEARFRWLVYEAEAEVTEWTRRCVRQADLILIAHSFDGREKGDVALTPVERYMVQAVPPFVERQLLLLHEGISGSRLKTDDWITSTAPARDLLRPGFKGFVAHRTRQLFRRHPAGGALRSTRHYLKPRLWAKRWHHVRAEEAEDWARCGRLLAGRGIGLCLGGSGARGNCHFGVLRALHELGVPVDVISGTSFGALAGAMISMSAPEPASLEPKVRRVMEKAFTVQKMLMDLNFPRTSYFTGSFLNRILQHVFARRRCEDLLVPFMCTSTDISNFEAKVHREGPLWRIVRASMSLVGFVPPLPFLERRPEDGTVCSSLLVDGGYANQYPIEALREHGASTVICIDACGDFPAVNSDYGDAVRGGLVMLRRSCGCRRRSSASDPPSQAEIQERLMFFNESMKEPRATRADFCLNPPIASYGLLEFTKYGEISDIGYGCALPELREWLAGDSRGAQRVREVVAMRAEAPAAESDFGLKRELSTFRRRHEKIESTASDPEIDPRKRLTRLRSTFRRRRTSSMIE